MCSLGIIEEVFKLPWHVQMCPEHIPYMYVISSMWHNDYML